MGSTPHRWFCAFKTAPLGPKSHVSMGPSPHEWFLDAKQRLLYWNYNGLWVQDPTCGFCMQNSDFWIRITSLYASQTWPAILCMYHSVLNIRNTSLYGSQHSSVVFTFKTAHYGPELLVSIFPKHDLSFCACTRACLASELLVSMGPSPHLWFFHAKQRLLDQHASLYGYQTSPVILCIQNSVISTRITSFNGFHPSSVVLCIQNSALRTKIACLYGTQPSCVVFGCKTATFVQELQWSVGPRPQLWLLHAKQRLLDQNNKSLCFPDMTCYFVHVPQRT